MKGASKVIMGATLVMVVTLAIVLGLVLVLLAELYCTLLLRRRRQFRLNSSNGATPTPILPVGDMENSNVLTHPPHVHNHSATPRAYTPRSCAPGVLEAPGSLFYPTKCSQPHNGAIHPPHAENHSGTTIVPRGHEAPRSLFYPTKRSQLRNFLQLQLHTQQSTAPTSPSPPPPLAISSSHQIGEIQIQINGNASTNNEEPFVYISNPIYDQNRVETPFETPDSSPSRLETGSGGSSSGDEERGGSQNQPSPATPPLTPMKKLPAEASSVSLRDARSLGTSGSDSVSNNGLSSSSSGSPCTSPSW